MHGRIIEIWSEHPHSYAEIISGDQRHVIHTPTHEGLLSQIQRGDLVALTKDSTGTLLNIQKLGSPSADTWNTSGDSMRWRRTLGTPSRIKRLWQRQSIINAVRADLVGAGFLEIETPLLVPSTCPDTHIDSITTSDPSDENYLVSSTEYQIKRMIVGGFDSVFTLTKNFRKGDRGRYHSSEFTMLEWARGFGTLDAIEADATRFTRAALQQLMPGQSSILYGGHSIEIMEQPWEQLTVREALSRYLNLNDLGDFSLERLLEATDRANVKLPENFKQDHHLILSFLLDRIQPHMGTKTPTFLREWPAYMTSSALINPKDPDTAERSELYIAGIEVADGFPFLRDVELQKEFFQRELARRHAEGKPVVQLDLKYVAALGEGIPPGAGMALGIDRLVMVLVGAEQLSDIQTFSWDEL